HSPSSNDRATKGTQPRVNVSIGRVPYRQLLLMSLSASLRKSGEWRHRTFRLTGGSSLIFQYQREAVQYLS
ncbi:hypothetical protein J6590_107483, partial [Homalodisca vitripennis]